MIYTSYCNKEGKVMPKTRDKRTEEHKEEKGSELNALINLAAESSVSPSAREAVKKMTTHPKSKFKIELDTDTLKMARLIMAMYDSNFEGLKEDEKMQIIVKMAVRSFFNGPFKERVSNIFEKEDK
jgi:hypothetical protein